MVFVSQSILYYPSIDIKDGPWLRGAALYWDQVRSIVPYEEYDDYCPEIAYMKLRGHYKPLYPQDVFVLGDPNQFRKLAAQYLFKTSRKQVRQLVRDDATQKYYLRDEPFTAMLHYKKLPDNFLSRLIEQGNISIHGEWVETSESFAFQYMKLLADYAVHNMRENIVLGADAKKRFDEIYPCNRKKNIGFEISLENCIPVPRPDVPFEYILDFKEQRHDELDAMQRKLQDFEDELRHSEDSVDVKSAVSKFQHDWCTTLKDFEKMTSDSRLHIVMQHLGAFVGSLETFKGLSDWVVEPEKMTAPVIATAVAGFGAIAVREGRRQLKRNRCQQENVDYAYILSASRAGIIQLGNETEWIGKK